MSPIASHNDNLVHFSRSVPTGTILLSVNMTRWEQLQRELFPHRIWAVTTLQAPDPTGFSSPAEAKLLRQAEEELAGRFVDNRTTVYLGALTHAGQHVAVFHSKSDNLLGNGPAHRILTTRYLWDVYYGEDPAYDFLRLKMIPSAREHRRVRDAEVLGALANAQDNTIVPRPLTFYGLFPAPQNAEMAAQQLLRAGFRPSPASQMPGNSALPWSLMFQRSCRTDPETIERISSAADEIIEACGGAYDGWSCEPVPMR